MPPLLELYKPPVFFLCQIVLTADCTIGSISSIALRKLV